MGVPVSPAFVKQFVNSEHFKTTMQHDYLHLNNQHSSNGAVFVNLNEWQGQMEHMFSGQTCGPDKKMPRWVFRALVPTKLEDEEKEIFREMREREAAGDNDVLAEALLDLKWKPNDIDSHPEIGADHVFRAEKIRSVVKSQDELDSVVFIAIDLQQYTYAQSRYTQEKVRLAYLPEPMWTALGRAPALEAPRAPPPSPEHDAASSDQKKLPEPNADETPAVTGSENNDDEADNDNDSYDDGSEEKSIASRTKRRKLIDE